MSKKKMDDIAEIDVDVTIEFKKDEFRYNKGSNMVEYNGKTYYLPFIIRRDMVFEDVKHFMVD